MTSAFDNADTRTVIRQTWGKTCNNAPWCSLAFIVGTSHDQHGQHRLQKESAAFGDILQEPFYDSYNNLTLKSIYLLKHFVKQRPRLKYLLKVDDDCFVFLGERAVIYNVAELTQLLKRRKRQPLPQKVSILFS